MSELTAEEITEPGRLVFPNGGIVDVDSIYNGQVCYRRWMPGAEEPDWLRTPIDLFVSMVIKHGGERADQNGSGRRIAELSGGTG